MSLFQPNRFIKPQKSMAGRIAIATLAASLLTSVTLIQASEATSSTLRSVNLKGFSGVLANSSSFSLYVLSMEKGGKLHCKTDCLTTWLPLLVKNSVKSISVGSGVSGRTGFIARGSGMKQVTYNSYPLYTYSGDHKAREARGEGMVSSNGYGTWLLVKASTSSATNTPVTTTPQGIAYPESSSPSDPGISNSGGIATIPFVLLQIPAASDGGSPITKFVLTVGSGHSCTAKAKYIAASALWGGHCTISGLMTGGGTVFSKVTSYNKNGASHPGPSNPVDVLRATMHAGDVISTPSELIDGSCLFSKLWMYAFCMTAAGDLQEYQLPSYTVLWDLATQSPATHLVAGSYATFQTDGNFVVYPPGGGTAVWATGTFPAAGGYLTIQDDGNLVIYNSSGTAVCARFGTAACALN
jgi:predicted lipoprotein with Yx(FWY)xxD motif